MIEPTPPPVIEETPPPQHPGYPIVWLGVFAALVLLAFGAYASLSDPGPVVQERAALDGELRKLEAEFPMALARHSGEEQQAAKSVLQIAMRRIGGLKLQTKGAAYVRDRAILVLQILAEPDKTHDCAHLVSEADDITESDLRAETVEQRKEINRALCALAQRAPKKDLEEARRVLEKYSDTFPLGLALRETERRLGIQTENSSPLWLGLLLVGGFGTGAVLWIAYLASRLSGKLQAAGLPLRGSRQELLVADSLGARFFGYLALFSIAPLAFVSLLRNFLDDETLARIVATALVAPLVVLVVAAPVLGVRLPLARLLGLDGDVRRHIAWGVAGWLANLPALFLLLIVTVFLSRWLPSGSHPLESELKDWGGILWAALAAGVLAPLVEEMTFRGCLFQGLAIRLRSPALAAVISSLAFASLHPQGPASWLVLGWIGAMGCFLTYQTGSVLPAMVMHSLHNLSIIAIAVSTKNSFGL
jgi:membrane protease YdiL (CAAX protease family)